MYNVQIVSGGSSIGLCQAIVAVQGQNSITDLQQQKITAGSTICDLWQLLL